MNVSKCRPKQVTHQLCLNKTTCTNHINDSQKRLLKESESSSAQKKKQFFLHFKQSYGPWGSI